MWIVCGGVCGGDYCDFYVFDYHGDAGVDSKGEGKEGGGGER